MRKKIVLIIIVIITIGFCYFDYQNGLIGGCSILYKSKLPMKTRPTFFSHVPSSFCFTYHSHIMSEYFAVNWYWMHPDTCNWDFVAYGYNDTSIIIMLEDTLGNKRYKISQIDSNTIFLPYDIIFYDINKPIDCSYNWIWVKKNYYRISRCHVLFSFLLITILIVGIIISMNYLKKNKMHV